MKIITTHQNPTFDSIAGVFAASLLNRDALIVLPKKLERVQKNFLSLHFKPGDFIYDDELDCSKVSEVTLICVKNPHRIASISKILDNPNILIAVYDKSPAIKCEIPADSLIQQECGSIAALICRAIFEAGIEVSPLYATLFALGIHEITGSLLYPNTAENDINCLAELFRRGSNLKTVNFFLKEEGLSNIQKSLLDDLVKSKEVVNINAVEINFYFAENHKFIYKFDSIIQRIIDVEKFNIAVFIARMGTNIHVLARSNVEQINLGEIFATDGGGGPKYAAYITFNDSSIKNAREKIITLLKKNMKPAVTARDIMRPSVLFLDPKVIISEAEKIMFRYAYTAAPVTDKKKVAGFIRKTDIDRAVHHGLSHAPISGFLCREIIYSPANEPFDRVVEKIARSETKTILVGTENKIVGIITSNDILNHTFTESKNLKYGRERVLASTKTPAGIKSEAGAANLNEERLKIKLDDYFNKPVLKLLKKISRKAAELKVSAYIAGGIVRDIILKKASSDIDIVIEGGSAIDFAVSLAGESEHITNRHERFKTAVIEIPGLPKIDFATARSEFYESPAALPDVFQGNLYQDLLRRDFTINAMAISLCQDNFGEIIDYYGGLDDIKKKYIKTLHSLSFIEDPTRIFRALRFKTRLKFKIEKHTADCIKEALKFGISKKIEPIRIFNELDHIFNEAAVYETVCELNKYGLFDFISGDIVFTDIIKKMIKNASKYLEKTAKLFAGGPRPNKTAIFLSILLLNEPADKIMPLMIKTNASRKIRDVITEAGEFLLITRTEFDKLIENAGGLEITKGSLRGGRTQKNNSAAQKAAAISDLDIFRLFKNRSSEFLIIFLSALNNKHAYEAIIRYIFKLSNITISINGNILKNMGVPPGPVFRIIIDKITEKKAAGLLKNHIDEIKCARELIGELTEIKKEGKHNE